ncbi:hypothetical protein Gotur_001325 [Gossypium turneri]
MDHNGISVCTGTIISDWGGRLELEIDRKARIWARVSRKQKISILVLSSAMGSNLREILENGNVKVGRNIKAFLGLINDCMFIDLPFKRQMFTWFCSWDWVDMFPDTQVFKLAIVGFHHSSLFVYTNCKDRKALRRFEFDIL